MNNVDDLFTWASLLTLQGSAAACYIVPNVLGKLIPPMNDLARAWVAFVLALGIQIAAGFTVDSSSVQTWVVAVLNGFLVAASALGINQFTSNTGGGSENNTDSFQAKWVT